MNPALSSAIAVLGSGAELARRAGVKPQVVSEWIGGGRRIPPGRCPAIEAATDGQVTCEQLRPDLEWAVLPDGRKVAVGKAPAKASGRKRAA
jgi:DNA-binding transcriptional regulator YdaS (Cro superfamily)